jgi:hypothetical protein
VAGGFTWVTVVLVDLDLAEETVVGLLLAEGGTSSLEDTASS